LPLVYPFTDYILLHLHSCLDFYSIQMISGCCTCTSTCSCSCICTCNGTYANAKVLYGVKNAYKSHLNFMVDTLCPGFLSHFALFHSFSPPVIIHSKIFRFVSLRFSCPGNYSILLNHNLFIFWLFLIK